MNTVCGRWVAVVVAVCSGMWAGMRVAGAEEGAAVEIRVDAGAGRRAISPYLYGRNHYALDNNAMPDPKMVADVGLRIIRDSCGNNCTKYNWHNDMSCHPDWYDNVYKQGWPERATKFSRDYGDLQALYSLPVLGWVAKDGGDAFNFTKFDGKPGPFNPPPGTPMCGGGKTELYLTPTTPKDAVDMLDHWFKTGAGNLGLDAGHFRYFHLDNEPESWPGTHRDVYPKGMTGEECVQKYVAVAKELKTRYPKVRVLAPGFTAEWFWWNWADGKPVKGMPWVQYFLKRMGEESKTFGKPLIDVVDFHTYIGGNASDAETLQEWRIFYDGEYKFPRANGCKVYPDGQWHENQKVELLFGRTEGWLEEYFGKGHGIGIGITECGPGDHPPMVGALWYGSMLGTFADHGVELFTPWEWHDQWWEVMHLFSRYGRTMRVEAASGDEAMVSAYASIGAKGEGMTVILLNREKTATRTAKVSVAGFVVRGTEGTTLTLAELPKGNTFKTHEENALKKGVVQVKDGTMTVVLPPYSMVAVVMDGAAAAGTGAKTGP